MVSNLTFLFGYWVGFGERGLSGLEVGLVRFFGGGGGDPEGGGV